MQALVKDQTLTVVTDNGTFEFHLPDPSNYPQDHVLAIPFVGYFVRVRANGEWELSDIIPQIVSCD